MRKREAFLRLVDVVGARRGVAFTVGADVWWIFAACSRARRETQWSAKVEAAENRRRDPALEKSTRSRSPSRRRTAWLSSRM